jgi:hypothetical protein
MLVFKNHCESSSGVGGRWGRGVSHSSNRNSNDGTFHNIPEIALCVTFTVQFRSEEQRAVLPFPIEAVPPPSHNPVAKSREVRP